MPTNTPDIVWNKTETIGRCISRIREEYDGNEANLRQHTKQDSIVLNLQRACEACIDLAMHVVSEAGLGIPQSSRDAFELLRDHNIIDVDLAIRMKAMVGFRNIAVHDYRSLQIPILKSIIEKHLGDFTDFAARVQRYAEEL